jgi:sugar lactone lactonase YvrE
MKSVAEWVGQMLSTSFLTFDKSINYCLNRRVESEITIKHQKQTVIMKTTSLLNTNTITRTLYASTTLLLAFTASAQNLFEGNWGDGSVNEFTPSAQISAFGTGDGHANALAFNAAGDLYAASLDGPIYEYAPNGARTTFASGLNSPWGIAFDASGNMFVSCEGGSILEYANNKGTLSSTSTTFYTGAGANSFYGDAFNPSGTLFACDLSAGSIYKFTAAGGGSVFYSGLTSPTGLTFDNAGNMYVSESGSANNIVKITPAGALTIFATDVFDPEQSVFDQNGNLFVACGNAPGGNSIDKITSGGAVSTFASGLSSPGGVAIQPVPEPSVLALLALGVSAAALRLRRKD